MLQRNFSKKAVGIAAGGNPVVPLSENDPKIITILLDM